MFSWKILIQDKDLPKVMWALDGLIMQGEAPVPVRGAKAMKASNGALTVKSINPGAGTLQSQFKTRVGSLAAQTKLNMHSLKQMAVELGASPTSSYAMVANLVKDGTLKKGGMGQYFVKH